MSSDTELNLLRSQIEKLERRITELETNGYRRFGLEQLHLETPLPLIEVPVDATRVVTNHFVFPDVVDSKGVVFGGEVLCWIDICAGMAAKILARQPCVTASVDAVHFLHPCTLNMVAMIAARVNRTFSSSMEVEVKMEAEDLQSGTRVHCCTAYLTFVVAAKEVTGARRSLPRVVPDTPELQAVWQDAGTRREGRLRQRERLKNDPVLEAQQRSCRLQPVTHRGGFPDLPPAMMSRKESSETPPSTLSMLNASTEHETPATSCPTMQSIPDSSEQTSTPEQWVSKQPNCASAPGEVENDEVMTATDAAAAAVPAQASSSAAAAVRAQAISSPSSAAAAAVRDEEHVQHTAEPLNSMLTGSTSADAAVAETTSTSANPMEEAEPRLGLSDQCGDIPSTSGPTLPNGATQSKRERVRPDVTRAYMTVSIMPQHANTLGITFGGQVMSWMEQTAAISASRLHRPHMMTASMDSIAFARPTQLGDILYVTAQVSAVFGSSLEVMVSVHGENPRDGVIQHCADAFVTTVCVDRQCRPVPIMFEIEPSTEADKLRLQSAMVRRAERLAMRQQLISNSQREGEMSVA